MPSVVATVLSAVLRGLECRTVEVEVDIATGSTPKFLLVGLAGGSVRESLERVRSALRNAGSPLPQRRVTVNLAPAALRKEGGGLDLAIAVAIALAERGQCPPPGCAFVGELALDGAVRHTNGVLVLAGGLAARGVTRLYVGAPDAAEAALVEGIEVVPCPGLGEVLADLLGDRRLEPADRPAVGTAGEPREPGAPSDDLSEVHGQPEGRRVLEVAAAGGHHLLMTGPPGSGKTMLARSLPGILPPLLREEALELARVASILGELDPVRPLVSERPFRSPHHTVSMAGLVGGGTALARPGEVTRAHLGVLFLDELAEFEPRTLQALRQPLEEGGVAITRSGGSVRYPCRFLLVAATNPCPCGWAGDSLHACRCSPAAVDAYARSLSGPLLDRIDLQVRVERVPLQALGGEPAGEASADVRSRVVAARRRQLDRQGCLNSELRPRDLRRLGLLTGGARSALERWGELRGLTARAYHRAGRVAATLADLEGCRNIEERHVLEALGYRLSNAVNAA